MGYIKQLDSLRAIAVFLVVLWHWVPKNNITDHLHAGSLGVNVFFVLSGFLITSILLAKRYEAENLNVSKTSVLKNFYARRVLRIFPIYYLTILAAVILNQQLALGVTRQEILSNVSYTTNFFIYFNRSWPLASLHFWSLAAEEQFYLAWPLLMLFLSKKHLIPAIITSIAIGFTSQLLTTDYEFGHLLITACLDCFGTGALLAFVAVYQPEFLQRSYKTLTLLSIISLLAIIISWPFNFYFRNTRFIHAVLSAWVINHILIYKNTGSALVSMLGNKLLISIGKVSYGIYLYHILYSYIACCIWYKYVYHYYLPFINAQYEPWIFLLVHFSILYLISLLSWKFIEKPFLSLKSRFQYQKM